MSEQTKSPPDEDDPIIASYDVYLKPQISATRRIYVCQFPNSQKHYSRSTHSEPLALRIKPTAGMLELDIPIDVRRNFDQQRGIKWGEAMRKAGKGGSSHGLPGGFGIGGNPRGKPKGDDKEEDVQALMENYEGAIRNGHVLTKQTLGGQVVPKGVNAPQYMVGTFRKGALHLTPVDHIAQLRPQFHYLDAQAEQEKAARAREASTITPRSQEARAVHMTVKTVVDGEDDSGEHMAGRLAAAQSEPWRDHKYIDEDSQEAWYAYEDNLFVGDEDGDTTGYPELHSTIDDLEYIDILSAPKDAAKMSRSKRLRDGGEERIKVET